LRENVLKPQIYKVGKNWIVWVPGVRVFRFPNWNDALIFALNPTATPKVIAASNAN
jgi:hypothetical protein